jgi:hypothetical protein
MQRIRNLQPCWKLLLHTIKCRPLKDELHIIGVLAPFCKDLENKESLDCSDWEGVSTYTTSPSLLGKLLVALPETNTFVTTALATNFNVVGDSDPSESPTLIPLFQLFTIGS